MANVLCWTVGKYLLVNINEEQENQETVSGNSDNEFHEWTGLEDNDVVSLTSGHPLRPRANCIGTSGPIF